MSTCIIIAVLIYHDVIIQILPSINMWLETETLKAIDNLENKNSSGHDGI